MKFQDNTCPRVRGPGFRVWLCQELNNNIVGVLTASWEVGAVHEKLLTWMIPFHPHRLQEEGGAFVLMLQTRKGVSNCKDVALNHSANKDFTESPCDSRVPASNHSTGPAASGGHAQLFGLRREGRPAHTSVGSLPKVTGTSVSYVADQLSGEMRAREAQLEDDSHAGTVAITFFHFCSRALECPRALPHVPWEPCPSLPPTSQPLQPRRPTHPISGGQWPTDAGHPAVSCSLRPAQPRPRSPWSPALPPAALCWVLGGGWVWAALDLKGRRTLRQLLLKGFLTALSFSPPPLWGTPAGEGAKTSWAWLSGLGELRAGLHGLQRRGQHLCQQAVRSLCTVPKRPPPGSLL